MTKLIAYGDSIFAGWNGKSNDSKDQRIPEQIGQMLGWEVTNTAISGAKFDDGTSGFPNMARIYSAAGYDYALVNFGVNDWCFPSGSLDYVKRKAREGIDNLRMANPSIKILLELPTEDVRKGSKTLYDTNSQGWTQNMLDNMLAALAKDLKIDYYDWRPDPIITYANASQKLGDGNTGVHPTPETSKEIATRLASKLKQMMAEKPDEPDAPNHGGKPAAPDKPAAKGEIDKPSLERLSDVFKISDNVDADIGKTVDKINEIYKHLAPLEGLEKPTKISKTRNPPGNSLVRILRNYVLLSTQDIQHQINDLIGECNRFDIVDPKTSDKTSVLELARPTRLATDSYYADVINGNWAAVEKKMNLLASYINETTKGIKEG